MLTEIKNIGVSGALSSAGAFIFTNVNPVNALAFGVVGRLVNEVTKPVFKSMKDVVVSDELWRVVDLGRFVAIVALSAAACTFIGLPISFSAALLVQICQLAFVHIGQYVFTDVCAESDGGRAFVQRWKLSSLLVPAIELSSK